MMFLLIFGTKFREYIKLLLKNSNLLNITIVTFLLQMYAADFCTCNDVSAETQLVTFSAMSIGD